MTTIAGSSAENSARPKVRPLARPTVLDCDTGIDDALAILLAALSPEINLVGIGCTWGNTDVDQATRNSYHLLTLVDRTDIPVARGAEGPRGGSAPSYAPHVHGPDGLGGQAPPQARAVAAAEDAADQLLRLSREHEGQLDLVAVGPLTNIAAALDRDPAVARRLRSVTIMGGAALSPGNVTPSAEANIYADPLAAAAVFAAPWSVTMVGLDVTMRHLLEPTDLDRLAAGGPLARFCAAMLRYYVGHYRRVLGRECVAYHDVLALAVASGLVRTELSPRVDVEVDTTDGPSRGRTIADLRGLWSGRPDSPEARHRVVLELEPGFQKVLVGLLLDAGPVRG